MLVQFLNLASAPQAFAILGAMCLMCGPQFSLLSMKHLNEALEALMLMYHALIGQKLRYGLICWATASKFLIDKINVMHNKVVRYLTFSKPCSRAWPLYCKLKILPLNILKEIEWGKMMYKYQNNMLPKAFDLYFRKPRHDHATRYAKQMNFEKIRASNAKDESQMKYIGPKKWANIPLKIKEIPFLKSFINSYREHLIENYE